MAVNKKEKRKKKTLTGCFERADGRAEADNCKKKKKERKGKKKEKKNLLVWACRRVTDGRACACRRTWMAVNKQTNKKRERKKKWNGLTAGGGHERAVRTLFEHCVRTLPNKDKLFKQCSNSTPPHGGLFEHHSNTWTRIYNMSEHCSDSVRTLPNKNKLFEQCSNSTPLHGGLFEHGLNTSNSVQTLPNKNKLFEKCSNTWKQV